LRKIKKVKERGSAYSHKFKIARWLFAIGVLFFVAKPFIGFAFHPANPAAQESILVKSFTKRKLDYVDNSNYDVKTIQKQLANPVNGSFLLFSCLLSILFPFIFKAGFNITGHLNQRIRTGRFPSGGAWLLDGQLII